MYHIAKVSAESANPSGKHFGRKVLRDTIKMWLDDFTQLEFNVAIQWLLDKNYLKTLGQHSVGTGTGKDIKQYDLNGYTPYKQISPEQMDAENSNVQKMHIANTPAKIITAADVIAGSFGNKSREQRKPSTDAEHQAVNDLSPSTESKEFHPIEQSLNTLEAKLNGKAIDNLNIKLRTLDGLARLLDPEISDVLNQIQHDLKEIAR